MSQGQETTTRADQSRHTHEPSPPSPRNADAGGQATAHPPEPLAEATRESVQAAIDRLRRPTEAAPELHPNLLSVRRAAGAAPSRALTAQALGRV